MPINEGNNIMAIRDLTDVIAPSARKQSKANLDTEWAQIEADMKIVFPADYKDYCFTYGKGCFYGGEMCATSPLHKKYSNFIRFMKEIYEVSASFNPKLKIGMYPDPKGFLPWGNDSAAHILCWRRDGKPDDWPVAVLSDDGDIEIWPMQMTTFLAKVLANKIRSMASIHPFDPKQVDFSLDP